MKNKNFNEEKYQLKAVIENLESKDINPADVSANTLQAINNYNRANEQAQLLIKQAIDWLDFAERALW